jgi:pimeloyl-ACP methyl ester carboxylesterase
MFVEVNGTKLFFDVEGAGLVPDGPQMRAKPTLILLHGGPGADHSMFKPAFSALSDVAQVIYLDHRGNGRSVGSSPDTWNLAQWGDDVKGFCDALGIEKPIVYGVSFGGFVAQSYATRHPDHPSKLILESTSARTDLDTIFSAFERLGGQAARKAAEAFWLGPTAENIATYRAVCYPLYHRHPVDPDQLKRRIVNLEVLFRFIAPGQEQMRMDFRAELKRIRCPVLVLAGDQDPITPMAFSEIIAECLPHHLVRLERFASCGHHVHVDDPRRAFKIMREFIAADI